jgi:hypothetical protein
MRYTNGAKTVTTEQYSSMLEKQGLTEFAASFQVKTFKYQVINRITGKIHGPYSPLKRATRKVDKIDNEYGAYIAHYKRVETEQR